MTISILKIYVRHVFNFKCVYIVSRCTHLTFKTFLTAATISLVCGRAAASNDCAYGMGTSAPNQIRKFWDLDKRVIGKIINLKKKSEIFFMNK